MYKIFGRIFGFGILPVLLGLYIATGVEATGQDSCNQEFFYFKDNDYEDARVEIDIFDFDGDNDRRAVINPKSVYKLIFLGIDYSGSDSYEATPSVGDGFTTIVYTAPNNQSIDHVGVRVKKTCSPTATPTASPSPTATATTTATATATATTEPTSVPTPTLDPCDGNCQEPTETPVATDAPRETPNGDVCPNIDGIQLSLPADYHFDNDGVNCLKFELGGAPLSPDSGIGGGDVLGASTGQVLGASTMADTGLATDSIFYSIFTLGSVLSSLGIIKGGKKKA